MQPFLKIDGRPSAVLAGLLIASSFARNTRARAHIQIEEEEEEEEHDFVREGESNESLNRV